MWLFVVFLSFFSFVSTQEAITSEFLGEKVKNYLEQGNSSEKCLEQFRELMNFDNGALFIDILDSSAKFPWPGVIPGSPFDFGNYDQCININHKYENGTIKGKYCFYGLIIPINNNTRFGLSICLPDACTEDYTKIFGPLFYDEKCHTLDDIKQYTAGDIVMILVLIWFAVVIITSTVYEVYKHKKQEKIKNQMLIAFSVYNNGKKLFKTSKGNRDQIQIFHGMKSISMAWVIAGHGMGGWKQVPVFNALDVEAYRKGVESTYITTAILGVDTFVYISGFLLGFLYIRQKHMPLVKHLLFIPINIIHRYLRLTPAAAMLYFFGQTLLKHLGTGPLWHEGIKSVQDPCTKYWYSFFFYFQNYHNYDVTKFCWIPTWYLSADMQLFLVAPLILIPVCYVLARAPNDLKKVMYVLLGLNIYFFILPMALKLIITSYKNEYDTHSRLIDYGIGITLGVYIRETKDKSFVLEKTKHPSLYNCLIWICTLFTLLVTSLINQEYNYSTKYDNTTTAIVSSITRPVWCIGLSWMVYSSYHGYGGIINWILTRPLFQIISKLSYCMYLLHGAVILHHIMLIRGRQWFNEYMAFLNWCAYFLVTLVLSIIWTLAFESPFMTIEKLIFGRLGSSQQKPKPQSHIQSHIESGVKAE